MMISVIIPAYNEGTTIERCLDNLLDGPQSSKMEVIVVCNGCKDDTYERAQKYAPEVKVLNLEKGSKILALNEGDDNASFFPRFYIDADIIVTQEALWKTASVLDEGEYLAAAPSMSVDLSKTTFAVKSYFKAWMNTPYIKKGMLGTGFYGMSKKGRMRFGQFPQIIADDGFVRLQYSLEERLTLKDCTFTVLPPKKFKWLIAINTRAAVGNIELNTKYPDLSCNEENQSFLPTFKILIKNNNLYEIMVYITLKLLVKIHARIRLRNGSWKIWDHDPTAREVHLDSR